MGLTLDTGALIALERNDTRTARFLRAAQREGREVTVPAPVLTQFWRGGWVSVELRDVLAHVWIEPTTAPLARRAGELLGRTGTTDAVDAIVACGAAERGDAVLTSDPEDLQRLADDLGALRIVGV